VFQGEFDPPPSPPKKLALAGKSRDFFVVKNIDGEMRGIPLKVNSTFGNTYYDSMRRLD
jgi:hypothetical protein